MRWAVRLWRQQNAHARERSVVCWTCLLPHLTKYRPRPSATSAPRSHGETYMTPIKRDGFIGLCVACAGAAVSLSTASAHASGNSNLSPDLSPAALSSAAQRTQLLRVQVERVDLSQTRLIAINRATGETVVVQVEPGTLVNGKHNPRGLQAIQSGDLVDVKLVPRPSGGYAVRDLSVNIVMGDFLGVCRASKA